MKTLNDIVVQCSICGLVVIADSKTQKYHTEHGHPELLNNMYGWEGRV